MLEPRDYLEMTFRSIQCFANDGRLDVHELGALLDIAERGAQKFGTVETGDRIAARLG